MPSQLEQFDISEQKKAYITDQVNPLLEEIVRSVLAQMPEEPLGFMVKFLKEKTGQLNYDVAATEAENAQLEAEIKDMEMKLKEVAAMTGSALAAEAKPADAESEEEEDDDIPEPPPMQPKSGGRQSVSAEAYGQWNQKQAFTPPVHPKSAAQREQLQQVLGKSFLFSALEEKDMGVVLDAVKEVVVDEGTRIIKQGDNGDFMFLCETGALECFVAAGGEEKMVKAVEPGDAFGELALLYNCPRAASVQAKEKSVCWQLDRETFNHIVKDAAAKKRERHTEFFKTVPLLNAVDAYGRSQVADALRPEQFAKGAVILAQGDPGDKFYILEKGSCKAVRTGDGPDKVLALQPGDYFGELALLNGEPRAATVTAEEDVQLLALDRRAFTRLLGSLRELLLGETGRYK